jgi:hypothetical protein
MVSPQMLLNTTYKHTQGERDRERGPTRTDREGTREEPLDGAGCNLGACVCSSYRWSSIVVIENMKKEIEGSERGVVVEGECHTRFLCQNQVLIVYMS